MPNPHFDIRIIKRSANQSAVAAAAYQSGEKLYSNFDKQTKHYKQKSGIVHTEILLPPNAPPGYTDRNTLWNAVEKAERQWNSQLARRFVLAIPVEIPKEQYADLVREYCQENFVSKGMCVDFAIHDVDGHNPHAHILTTLRAMDEHGKWLPKTHKVYDLDENGERIRQPSGGWKSHKADTVDWNEQKYGTIWRQAWQDKQNEFLERNNRPERVDLRSYEKQGLDQAPTLHMGPAVMAMEERGIQTEIGNANREIGRINALIKSIKQKIKELFQTIADLYQMEKELQEQEKADEARQLPNLLMKCVEIRKRERSDWTMSGQQRATVADLKKATQAITYLDAHNLRTLEDVEQHIAEANTEAEGFRSRIKAKERRIRDIDTMLSKLNDFKTFQPIYEQYQKIFFKKSKEKFKLDHPEVERYEKAEYYLKKRTQGKSVDVKALKAERAKLTEAISQNLPPLEALQNDLKQLSDIRFWARKATPGTDENTREERRKQSVFERMEDLKREECTRNEKIKMKKIRDERER